MTEKKPWYKSKIALLALSAALVFGSNFFTGWLSGQGVTPEQLDALQQAAPEALEAVKDAADGKDVLSAVGALFGVLIFVFRKWFTTKLLI